jgi:hypothetical protein
LDADLYFYGNPLVLLDEFHTADASVLITEHRYTPCYDQTVNTGFYCVQFVTFRRDEVGLQVLNWWKERCLEWCFARIENGKFGDQKYLDNWPKMFDRIHVLQHLGGGIAPWNVQQYEISTGPTVNSAPVIFYHFHNLRFLDNGYIDLGIYRIPEAALANFYDPYFASIARQFERVRAIDKLFNKGNDPYQKTWKTPLRALKRRLNGTYHVIKR